MTPYVSKFSGWILAMLRQQEQEVDPGVLHRQDLQRGGAAEPAAERRKEADLARAERNNLER